MSFSLKFTGPDCAADEVFDGGSASGWVAFGQWADTLPTTRFDAIRNLAEVGSVTGTDRLAKQLVTARKSHPPDAATAAIIRMIRRCLHSGSPDETMTLIE